MQYLPITVSIIAVQAILFYYYPMNVMEDGWEGIIKIAAFAFIQFILFATSVGIANSNKEPKQ